MEAEFNNKILIKGVNSLMRSEGSVYRFGRSFATEKSLTNRSITNTTAAQDDSGSRKRVPLIAVRKAIDQHGPQLRMTVERRIVL
ncbi:MAG: hypothetical protein C0490_21900 [Marivirga sp.]|nr:hypothetical protein [Marivirga sp.]